MSWQDWVQLIAVVVAALAALGALCYAQQTMHESRELLRESRDLRREDRFSRLADVAGDYGALLAQQPHAGTHAAMKLPSAAARLRAHITAAGEPLPACAALLSLAQDASPTARVEATDAALEEIGKRLAGK